MKKKGPKFLREFQEFLSRGNVMDLAVAVVMGAAFTAIVDAVVADLIMPLITALTGGLDFSAWYVEVGTAKFTFGNFIGAVINFIIIGFVIFLMIKIINKMRQPDAPPRLCPYCKMEVAEDATRCPHCTSILETEGDDPQDDPLRVADRRTRRQID